MGFEGRGFKSHHWSYVLRPIATLGQHFRAKGILDRFEATGVVVKIAEILGVEVGGSNPLTPTDSQMSVLDTWVTVYSEDIGNTFGPKGFSIGSRRQVSSSK